MESRNRQLLIFIVGIGLIVSVAWTYINFKSNPTEVPMPGVTLSVIPEYKIESGTDLTVWPKGTFFEQGRAAYFYAAKPKITTTPIIKINGMNEGLINGTVKSKVFIQSVDEKSQTYWSYKLNESPLNEFTLSAGKAFNQNPEMVLDIPDAYSKVNKIGEELLFQSGLFQLLVVSDIKVSGTVNGVPIEKSIVHTLPINLLQTSFTIPKSQEITSKISLIAEGKAPALTENLLRIIQFNIIPFVIDFILLLLLVALYILKQMGKPKAAKDHTRFKEWITDGSVEVKDRQDIQILSLEGLVDLAIDLDKRVIYDSKVNRYYVLAEDIVYIYDTEKTNSILENKQQLGKLLLDRELIKPEQLEIGLYHQKKFGIRLGESLLALGYIDETGLYSTLASQSAIDYYELNPEKEKIDTKWIDKLSVRQAKALMAIPLGVSSDERLVIACSQTSREGITDVLQEIFNRKVHIVASRPSAIYEILEAIEKNETEKKNDVISDPVEKDPNKRMGEEDRKHFVDSYHRGYLRQELFLKALGFLDANLLIQIPEKENILSWMLRNNIINRDMANLIKGLSAAIKAIDRRERYEHKLPDLLELLYHSNYITHKTKDWLTLEVTTQAIPLHDLIRNNLIASQDTLADALIILETLEALVAY